jgi:hypothetical protein
MLVGHMMIYGGSTIPDPQYAKLFINHVSNEYNNNIKIKFTWGINLNVAVNGVVHVLM